MMLERWQGHSIKLRCSLGWVCAFTFFSHENKESLFVI